jgi:hypothetical protein
MTRDKFAGWLTRYIEAWRSYDPDAIGDLFSEDATYSYRGGWDNVQGREAIVADWVREQDDAGTYDATYEPLAIDGDVHVARGTTTYRHPDGSVRDEYSNVFVCTFDAEGRCSSFTEWFVKPQASPA